MFDQPVLVHAIAAAFVWTLWSWGLMWWVSAFLVRSHHRTVGQGGGTVSLMHGIGGTTVLILSAIAMAQLKDCFPRVFKRDTQVASQTGDGFLIHTPDGSGYGLTMRYDAMLDRSLPVTYADVDAAAQRLQSVARRTPVLASRQVDEGVGAHVFFKCENFQRAGAFKFRGTYNALGSLSEAQRRRGVVTFSSGNHAQAVALAAELLNIPATIVMPEDAPFLKLAATRSYCADVILYSRGSEDREAIASRCVKERGVTLIPSYDHRDVFAGQGTVARELIEQVGRSIFFLFPSMAAV